jgi:hypothetical protein
VHQGKAEEHHNQAGCNHTVHNHLAQIQEAEPVHTVKMKEASGPAEKADHKRLDHNHLAVVAGCHSQTAAVEHHSQMVEQKLVLGSLMQH